MTTNIKDQNGWQPIETAPSNTSIILYAQNADYGQCIYVGGIIKNYFYVTNSDCQSGCGNTGTPTHWMPLPDPPNQ